MTTQTPIHIRPATGGDMDFILALTPRLVAFGPPAWRNGEQMTAFDTQVLSAMLTQQPPGTAIFIAEDAHGIGLGFIHLEPGSDYYYHDVHGHIGNSSVAPEGEGQGIGRRLLEHAETWARAQGFQWLTLSVFAQNVHARAVYERLGYGVDIIHYVKDL